MMTNTVNTKTMTYTHSFDELLTAKYFFEQRVVSDKSIGKHIISVTNDYYKNSAMGAILKLVAKYLLHADIYESEEDKKKYQTPIVVRDLVWKWLVVYIYKNLKPTGELVCEALEKFKDGIDVYDLINLSIEDDSVYAKLLQKNENNTDKIYDYFKEHVSASKASVIKNMYRLNMNYFQYDNDLKYYTEDKKTIKIELIVCEVMLDSTFDKFSFEILEQEEFEKNLKLGEDRRDALIKDSYIFTGIFINDLLKLKQSQRKEYLLNRNRVNLATLDSRFTISNVVKFIKDDKIAKREIIYKEINPFKFKYNDIEYTLSRDGIRKVNQE